MRRRIGARSGRTPTLAGRILQWAERPGRLRLMTDGIRTHLNSLRLISLELNEATNAAQREVKEVEKALNEMNLGVEGDSAPFFREEFPERCRPGVEVWRSRQLRYGRFSGRFCIHVTEWIEEWDESKEDEDGLYDGGIVSVERFDWSSLCREEKLKSVGFLDNLTDALLTIALLDMEKAERRPELLEKGELIMGGDWIQANAARFALDLGCTALVVSSPDPECAVDDEPPTVDDPTSAGVKSRRAARPRSPKSTRRKDPKTPLHVV